MHITEPGFYDIDHATYHADPCPAPSLNHTVARLLMRSPLHAWRAHPRLGGLTKREATRPMNIGAAAHALTFGKGVGVARLDFDNYRTKDAQNARDAAYAQGFVPLLPHEYETAKVLADHARPALIAELGEDFIAEQAAAAIDDNGSWLRIMADAMTPDRRVVFDLKVVVSAEPEAFGRWVRNECATQAAFYNDVLDILDPGGRGKRRFIYAAQERDLPEAITFHELDPAAMEIAQKQMERARIKWAVCLREDRWPAYDRGPHLIAPKPWEIEAEIEADYQDQLEGAGA